MPIQFRSLTLIYVVSSSTFQGYASRLGLFSYLVLFEARAQKYARRVGKTRFRRRLRRQSTTLVPPSILNLTGHYLLGCEPADQQASLTNMKLIWFAGLAGLLSTTIANFLKPQKDHRLLTGFNHKFFVDYGLESHFSCLYTIKEVQAMTDYFRPDPYNNTEFRRLLVTIYTPTYDVDCRKTSDIVLPPKSTAHYREVFSQFGIPPQYITDCRQASCTRGEFHGNNGGFFPMIIFSPDYTLSRELYCVQAENMARRGYVVFVLDNPGETSVVEFPNGDVIWGKNLTSKLTPEEAAFHSDVSTFSYHAALTKTRFH